MGTTKENCWWGILTDDDKKNIASLAEATMYCEYPDGMSVKKVEEFMNQFNGE